MRAWVPGKSVDRIYHARKLGASIDEAHKHNLKLTGHLCSVTFREAAELGIDNLEHGFIVATDFVPDKKPDICPAGGTQASFLGIDPQSTSFQDLLHTLISHHVVITSTLPVFELGAPGRPVPDLRMLDSMSADAHMNYLTLRATSHSNPNNHGAAALRKEMDLERAFAAAGGTLMAGPAHRYGRRVGRFWRPARSRTVGGSWLPLPWKPFTSLLRMAPSSWECSIAWARSRWAKLRT